MNQTAAEVEPQLITLALQVQHTGKACAAACAPISAAEGDPGMLEAGLSLIAEAIGAIEALATMLRDRRTEYFLALSAQGPDGKPLRSQQAIANLAGISDVAVGKALKIAREPA